MTAHRNHRESMSASELEAKKRAINKKTVVSLLTPCASFNEDTYANRDKRGPRPFAVRVPVLEEQRREMSYDEMIEMSERLVAEFNKITDRLMKTCNEAIVREESRVRAERGEPVAQIRQRDLLEQQAAADLTAQQGVRNTYNPGTDPRKRPRPDP